MLRPVAVDDSVGTAPVDITMRGQEPQPLLTPVQILDLWNFSMRSFRRWSASGDLEVVRLSRSIRVRLRRLPIKVRL